MKLTGRKIAGSPTLVGSEADLALPLGWFVWRTICRNPLYFMGKVIENPWFPVEFPENQSVDWIYSGTRTRGNKHVVWQLFLTIDGPANSPSFGKPKSTYLPSTPPAYGIADYINPMRGLSNQQTLNILHNSGKVGGCNLLLLSSCDVWKVTLHSNRPGYFLMCEGTASNYRVWIIPCNYSIELGTWISSTETCHLFEFPAFFFSPPTKIEHMFPGCYRL